MTPEQTAVLCCPICRTDLRLAGQQLVCANRHSFDLARQGYVNLHPVQFKQSKAPGDSKEMVAARQCFLEAGHYQPIAQTLVKLVSDHAGAQPKILDAGCGEGYYLDYLLANTDGSALQNTSGSAFGFGLDIAKPAIHAASKRSKDIAWIVGTNAQLPFLPATLDVVLCMFGFPVWEAFQEALASGGIVVLVEAGPRHLLELREIIYPEVRQRDVPALDKALAAGFELIHSESLCYQTQPIDQTMLQQLLLMTPHLFRATAEGKQAVQQVQQISLTVEVCFRILRGTSVG